MYHYIYRITCLHPDSIEKYYYGSRKSHKEPHLDRKYWSSSKYVKNAIDKFGIQFFKKKIIRIVDSFEKAVEYESLLHEKFDVDLNPIFFNKSKVTKWGYRCTGHILRGRTYEEIMGDEKAKKLKSLRAELAKGKNNSGAHNPMFGRKHSEASVQRMRETKQGKNNPSFNKKWVNNGTIEKKIFIENLTSEWKLGRLFHSRQNQKVA